MPSETAKSIQSSATKRVAGGVLKTGIFETDGTWAALNKVYTQDAMETKTESSDLSSQLRYTIGLVCKGYFSVKSIDGLFIYSGCNQDWWVEPKYKANSVRENQVNGWFEGIQQHAPEREVEIAKGVCARILGDPYLYDNYRQAIEMVLAEITGARHPSRLTTSLLSLHPKVIAAASKLFDDGHYQEAVFAAYRSLVEEVKTTSGRGDLDGSSLMQQVFSPKTPTLVLSDDPDEQLGYMWLFAGAVMAIRNPRAHKSASAGKVSTDETLELLAFASTLFRKLEQAQKP